MITIGKIMTFTLQMVFVAGVLSASIGAAQAGSQDGRAGGGCNPQAYQRQSDRGIYGEVEAGDPAYERQRARDRRPGYNNRYSGSASDAYSGPGRGDAAYERQRARDRASGYY